MVVLFDILYLPLRDADDHFLLCYEPLEAEKTRLYPSSSPALQAESLSSVPPGKPVFFIFLICVNHLDS